MRQIVQIRKGDDSAGSIRKFTKCVGDEHLVAHRIDLGLGGQFDGAEIAYRLRDRKDAWKIIDVVIEGVSLVSNYRTQFASVLNGGTIDDLIAKLKDKNFVVDESEPADG